MIENWSITVRAFPMRMFTLHSVDKIWLPRYMTRIFIFKGLPLKVEKALFYLKDMNPILSFSQKSIHIATWLTICNRNSDWSSTHKTATIQSLTVYLSNYQSKSWKSYWTQQKKWGRTHQRRWPPPGHTNIGNHPLCRHCIQSRGYGRNDGGRVIESCHQNELIQQFIIIIP